MQNNYLIWPRPALLQYTWACIKTFLLFHPFLISKSACFLVLCKCTRKFENKEIRPTRNHAKKLLRLFSLLHFHKILLRCRFLYGFILMLNLWIAFPQVPSDALCVVFVMKLHCILGNAEMRIARHNTKINKIYERKPLLLLN